MLGVDCNCKRRLQSTSVNLQLLGHSSPIRCQYGRLDLAPYHRVEPSDLSSKVKIIQLFNDNPDALSFIWVMTRSMSTVVRRFVVGLLALRSGGDWSVAVLLLGGVPC